MKMETEITVLVNTNYETLKKELNKNNFFEKEKYIVNDVYLVNSMVDIENMSSLDILKNCVLVRDIVGFKKLLLYKYKKYDLNNNILEQGKIECPITDIDKAIQFMKMIKYEKLININDTCIVYSNNNIELVVQLVNDKYIFIEIESSDNNVDNLKNEICKYDFSIDKSNFFVKKAEIILNETLKR